MNGVDFLVWTGVLHKVFSVVVEISIYFDMKWYIVDRMDITEEE
jgi:hypothetical protein